MPSQIDLIMNEIRLQRTCSQVFLPLFIDLKESRFVFFRRPIENLRFLTWRCPKSNPSAKSALSFSSVFSMIKRPRPILLYKSIKEWIQTWQDATRKKVPSLFHRRNFQNTVAIMFDCFNRSPGFFSSPDCSKYIQLWLASFRLLWTDFKEFFNSFPLFTSNFEFWRAQPPRLSWEFCSSKAAGFFLGSLGSIKTFPAGTSTRLSLSFWREEQQSAGISN